MMKPEPAAGQTQTANNDDLPWWMKYGVRFLGSVAAVGALVLGAMACISITPRCILAGICQMLFGLLVALIEAPFLCMFLDFAQVPSAYFDGKPPWMRGLLYIVISIIPISLCAGISTFFGSGLIFVTGSMYGMLSLRRKAPLQDMRMQASSSYNLLQNSRATGDVESGNMQPRSGDPMQAGVTINVMK
ncbi:hypothetical protein JTE90_028975 [Oedothorax gibbosus]|uniref:Calcium channel flower n=1 Tax=Oedothorax gibbosus TaxID=931172 RepID=A0AAV6VH60_9ARAC|nr:hypothetical protein JTE90_028975 [Oedothorax gibbosus]